jgi:hypothetical protein
MSCRASLRVSGFTALCHPEWFVHLPVRTATCDPDVTQGSVAQSFWLAAGGGSPLPFRDSEFQLVYNGSRI